MNETTRRAILPDDPAATAVDPEMSYARWGKSLKSRLSIVGYSARMETQRADFWMRQAAELREQAREAIAWAQSVANPESAVGTQDHAAEMLASLETMSGGLASSLGRMHRELTAHWQRKLGLCQ